MQVLCATGMQMGTYSTPDLDVEMKRGKMVPCVGSGLGHDVFETLELILHIASTP